MGQLQLLQLPAYAHSPGWRQSLKHMLMVCGHYIHLDRMYCVIGTCCCVLLRLPFGWGPVTGAAVPD